MRWVMFRKIVSTGLLAGAVLVPFLCAAAEGDAAAPLAKPGETFVSMQVEGCTARCPSFEIYIFDSGRMTFRSNNQYTAEKGLQHKNGMGAIHTRIAKYLQDTGALAAHPECTAHTDKTSVV